MIRGECRDGQWFGQITMFWESSIKDTRLEVDMKVHGMVRIVYCNVLG